MLEQQSHQLLLDHFLNYCDQFSIRNEPMLEQQPPDNYRCNSHVELESPTITYGAHTPPTLIHSNSQPQNTYVADALTIDDFQGVQHINQWTRMASENSSIIESMNRATPYSPEEKKERIERYRSKRCLRNFTKKIKYECRKTLADSRPRVKGRFARNYVEIEKTCQSQWDHRYVDQEDDDHHININHDQDYNWITLLDAFATNLMPSSSL